MTFPYSMIQTLRDGDVLVEFDVGAAEPDNGIDGPYVEDLKISDEDGNPITDLTYSEELEVEQKCIDYLLEKIERDRYDLWNDRREESQWEAQNGF